MPEAAFQERDDRVHLRLVRTGGQEVICDQFGREVYGVYSYVYESNDPGKAGSLTIKVNMPPALWSAETGKRDVGGKGESS